jgi:hypothetical protein
MILAIVGGNAGLQVNIADFVCKSAGLLAHRR